MIIVIVCSVVGGIVFVVLLANIVMVVNHRRSKALRTTAPSESGPSHTYLTQNPVYDAQAFTVLDDTVVVVDEPYVSLF